jgi:hypothetical protein
MTILTGGCQCGAVRYRFNGTVGDAGVCHCRMCQKAGGNFGLVLVSMPKSELTFTRGKAAEFRSSPIVARGFCAACGTPLYMLEDGWPIYEVTVGSLDEPDRVAPTHQVGIESERRWFHTLSDLPAKRTEDDRTPADLAKLKSLQHPDHETGRWPPD